jgi:hypothetical protein
MGNHDSYSNRDKPFFASLLDLALAELFIRRSNILVATGFSL